MYVYIAVRRRHALSLQGNDKIALRFAIPNACFHAKRLKLNIYKDSFSCTQTTKLSFKTMHS